MTTAKNAIIFWQKYKKITVSYRTDSAYIEIKRIRKINK